MSKLITIINGPNLNTLGQREPEIYGHQTLDDVRMMCENHVPEGYEIRFLQSNYEGQLVDWIQEVRTSSAGLIINPAAYSHTSIAIYDALKTLDIPIIEVHLSNIYAREKFRHHSYVSELAKSVLAGFGTRGYLMALDAILHEVS